jgi:hypothetical protein
MAWKDDPYKFMNSNIFAAVIDELAVWRPKGRLELDERGEPTYHPDFFNLIRYARNHLPETQITVITNGDLASKVEDFPAWLNEAFEAGLNIAVLDCYTQKRYEQFNELFADGKDFYRDGFNPYHYHGSKNRIALVVDCTPVQGVTGRSVRYLTNQAGNVNMELAAKGGYPFDGSPRQVSMCSRPFHDMALHCNDEGEITVPFCCNDWSDEIVIGQFPSYSLQEIWWFMDDFRRQMIEQGRQTIPLCAKCSYPQFRAHLEKRWFDA